jgi:hypothetical protein
MPSSSAPHPDWEFEEEGQIHSKTALASDSYEWGSVCGLAPAYACCTPVAADYYSKRTPDVPVD